MDIRIALAGNPNSGKTTLFNGLTGSNQFVGNWPGVTVEKKEGKLRKHDNVKIVDLPGIYSLSPYTMEEVVARDYLVNERPDAILNIVDGTNLERNLYLTTQLLETGIPMIVAVNMMDIVEKNGDKIDIEALSTMLGCTVVTISALKNKGIMEAADAAIKAFEDKKPIPIHQYSGPVEHALAHIEEAVLHDMQDEHQRWYAIKIFERDKKVQRALQISEEKLAHIENDIAATEKEMDDDAESIITNERYIYIAEVIKAVYRKKSKAKLSTSDKIDKVVTNRILGLPIFAVVMYFVYWVSMVAVGTPSTDWTNDCLFGDGWHLFGKGAAEFEEASEEYNNAKNIVEGYLSYTEKNELIDGDKFEYTVVDEETLEPSVETATKADYEEAVKKLEEIGEEPDPANYGTWVPGIPPLVEGALDKAGVDGWLKGLILDGIVAGVGAVLGFLPQMLVLYFMLAILEACGYMARIAFVLDRIFRRFGLSGKSFIPMLVGTGCSVPGIMASRTIENESDRRMTIMTTSFIPCGAKIPFIAMVAGAIFGKSAWVATSAYFVGMLAVVVSGIILKKTKMFAGEPAPFVMELPAYHVPTAGNVLRSVWERGWSFVRKAGSIILLSTIFVWFTSFFGVTDEGFRMLSEDELDLSILAAIGRSVSWIFAPLGWGNWRATVASVTGLVAKENIVGTMGILYGGGDGTVWQTLAEVFTTVSGYSFLVFNLLCAPCFAAIGAIKREMNNQKWTLFALAYQTVMAYVSALLIYQFGIAFQGNANIIGLTVSIVISIIVIYLLFIRKKYNKNILVERDK